MAENIVRTWNIFIRFKLDKQLDQDGRQTGL